MEACLPPDPAQTAPKQKRYVLHGLGGSGKTQLCLKFAEDHRDKFWGVFWIDMSTDASVQRSFSRIGRVCGLGEDVEMVRRWLSHCDQPWLLIMDNADNPQQKISQSFPVCNRGTIIITTRNPKLASHATVGWQVVDRLEMEEAISLLLRTTHENTASPSLHETARPVAEILGCLALAIVQAGAAINHGLCNLAEFPLVFSGHRLELLNRHAGQISEDYEKTVYTTWEISLSMIQAMSEPVSIDAMDLLRVFGFMHYDGIPETIFNLAWENLRNEHSSNWVLRHQLQLVRRQKGPQWDSYPLREALSTLSSFSLITYNKDRLISLHPLVHSWIRLRLDHEQQEFLWKEAIATLTGAIRWQFTIDDYRVRRLLVPHLNACLSVQEDRIFHLLTESPDCLDIVDKISCTYAENGQHNEALKLTKKMVEVRKRILGEEHPDTVRSMHNLAISYGEVGRRQEALVLTEKVVEMSKRILGEEHPKTVTSMHNLAGSYGGVGQRQKALVLMEKVVEVRKRILGKEHPDTVTSMHNLASSYSEVGRRQEALVLTEKVVEVRKRILGEEHPKTVTSMHNLASSYSEVGRRQEALVLTEKVVEMSKRILGEEHPDTVESMHNLAVCYKLLNRGQEALVLMRRVAAISKRIRGAVDLVTLESLRELAVLYSQINEFAKALQLANYVYSAFRKEFGEEHRSTLKSMNDLANIYSGSGQKQRALDMATEVAMKKDKVLGREHPDTLTTMHDLARIEFDMGQRSEAIKHMKGVVEDRRRILGEEHPDTIESQVYLEQFTIADGIIV